MSGSYGWSIDDVERDGCEYETRKMPMPYDEDSSSTSSSSSESEAPVSHPEVKGFYWCEYSGSIPATAVRAGVGRDGGIFYVGRSIHEGEMHPAKIVSSHGCAYISYDGAELSKADFEVLCRSSGMVLWQECKDGAVPPDAVQAGVTAEEEKLYVGRVFHSGMHIPGKVHPSHECCYISHDGGELRFTTYEVLIIK